MRRFSSTMKLAIVGSFTFHTALIALGSGISTNQSLDLRKDNLPVGLLERPSAKSPKALNRDKLTVSKAHQEPAEPAREFLPPGDEVASTLLTVYAHDVRTAIDEKIQA